MLDGSPTRCGTWSPTRSTTAARRPPSGSPPGKPAQATVTCRARAAGSTVVIEVADDGRGVDEDALRAAAVARGLLPADSTAQRPGAAAAAVHARLLAPATTVTETSGRGVGLDVVRTRSRTSAAPSRCATEPGAGTTFVLTLPVTLGVLRCLVARVGDERYAVPVAGVVETLGLRDAPTPRPWPASPCSSGTARTIPLVDLGQRARTCRASATRAPPSSCSTAAAGEQLAWAVDGLEGELELVVKDLGALPRPAADASPARRSTATAASCWSSTCASSPSGSSPGGTVRRRRPRPSRRTPATAVPGRSAQARRPPRCSSSRTPSGCASCSG